MPRIIFKCPHLKPGAAADAAHRDHYVRYIATRDGTEKCAPDKSGLPATKKQRRMAAQLLREFPLSRGLFEYEDYAAAPTRGNASAFITRAVEDNIDQIAKRENYVSYIAQRPRAERVGSHGLFSGTGDALALSKIAAEVANHPSTVWLPILSLRREDAARLGYDSVQQWRTFLTAHAMELAEALKIPPDQFRWYAAFHDQSHHPHVHMVCCSADGRSGFLTKDGIAQIKGGLAKEIFRQELTEIYQRQTVRRDDLVREAGAVMDDLIRQMREGSLENPRIERLMEQLAERLRHTTGKKQYGYLKAPLKAVVDEIVDELEQDSRIGTAYDLWYQLREEVLRTYKDDLPLRLPLSQQKEFKRIKNLVIEEAVRLGTCAEVFAPADIVEPEAPEEPLDAEELAPEAGVEVPPAVKWSDRCRQARSFLSGTDDAPPDFEKAFALFLEEARSGSALAMYGLGRMYADGLGQKADAEQAQAWYAKALAAFQAVERQCPNRYAEYRIGWMLLHGMGTEQDESAALEWLTKAAEAGLDCAQYTLGKLLIRGESVPKDTSEGLRWLTASAGQGNQFAQYALGKFCLLGKEVPQDRDAAARWFALSAAQGNEYAQFFLEHMNNDSQGPSPLSCATQLLRHMGGIFREQAPSAGAGIRFVDSKLRRRIKEKKMALGQKADDHEDYGIHMR